MHSQGFAVAVVGAWGVERVTTDDLASGADGVELVGLAAVFARLLACPVELDDPFVGAGESCGESAPEARSALDRPDSFAGRGVLFGPGDGVVIAGSVGAELSGVDDTGGRGVDDRGGDPVFVGVDADDVVDQFCKRDVGASQGAEVESVPVWEGTATTEL